MVDKHRDFVKELKEIIEDLEYHSQEFHKKELIEKAKAKGISEEDAEEAFDHLLEEHYIRHIPGREDLYERAVWDDYSPAFEEHPEF